MNLMLSLLAKRLLIFSKHGVAMRILLNLKRSWSAIRWKMLIIFAFFSVISMILVACFAVAVLNVLIRRESAYLIEERIKVIVDGRKKLTDSLVDRVSGCQGPASDSPCLLNIWMPRGQKAKVWFRCFPRKRHELSARLLKRPYFSRK